ncbi:MAG TPA: CBS domain-containing protein [Actinomycetota bacterium]
MKIKDIALEKAVTTDIEESISDAADRMRFYDIGALPIMDGHRLLGIITERDIVRAVANRSRMELTPAADYMTPSPATIGPEADIEHAAAVMVALRVRHLPVVEGGRLIGMISLRDVLGGERDLAGIHPV